MINFLHSYGRRRRRHFYAAQVGGLERAKRAVQEMVVWPVRYPEAFSRMGITPASGVLLFGPPGIVCESGSRAVLLFCVEFSINMRLLTKRWLTELLTTCVQHAHNMHACMHASPTPPKPTGTGKTLLAKAAATETGATFIELKISDVVRGEIGESEKVSYSRASSFD